MDWKQTIMTVLTPLFPWIIGLVVANGLQLLPGVTQHFFIWLTSLSAHTKNEYVRSTLNRFITLAGQKVLMLENTEIELLKTKAAAGLIKPSDLPGLLTEVKQKAIDAVKADASAQNLLKDGVEIFASEGGLTKWLGDVVESHVAMLPPSGLQTKVDTSPAKTEAAPAVPQPAAP